MSDEPIETECPTCGYPCEHDGKEYTPVRIYTDAHPNWDAMTAEEIASVIESAPVVLGEWTATRCGSARFRPGHPNVGSLVWVEQWRNRWQWGIQRGGSMHTAPTREAAMAAADAAARERGWRLMGGE